METSEFLTTPSLIAAAAELIELGCRSRAHIEWNLRLCGANGIEASEAVTAAWRALGDDAPRLTA